MAAPLAQAQEAITEGMAKFDPHGPVDMIDFFGKDLPGLFEEMARAVDVLRAKCSDELPIGQATCEGLGEIAATCAGLHDAAVQLNALFRAEHEKEIERHEAPRPGEEVWNVGGE